MSKLNALRIVNLNYNNNTMKINDETFEFGGESTLLSLRNGGGKTVMVQMIMAPFVNGRYRDLKDRAFEGYFTTSTPTYILTEWLLDSNSAYVLIGMGIRRKPAARDEESGSELEIITFIHEYTEGNRYDIHNIQVTEKMENGFKVKSLSKVKSMMDEIKGDRRYIFNYFDMDVDSQRRKYFETLAQYNINHREWESIIRKVNLKESGLSELFQEAKTISGLVEKWFLPTISDKLNDKEDKIKNFQEIMKKFIFQYKENESKIVRRQGIEEFKNHSAGILKAAEDFKTAREETENIKNDIANLYEYLRVQEIKLEGLRAEMENQLRQHEDELGEIEYERLSYEYSSINSEIIAMHGEEENLKRLIDRLEGDMEACAREIVLQECAKLYGEYREYSGNVQYYENRLELARSQDADRQDERNDLGFTLKRMYEEIIQKQQLELEHKDGEKSRIEDKIKELEEHKDKTERSINRLTGDRASLKEKLESFSRAEGSFNERYGQYFTRNIVGEYDAVFMEAYSKNYDERMNNTASRHAENINALNRVKEELPVLRRDKENTIKREADLENELKNRTIELKKLNQSIDEIRKILLYSSIDEERVFDREYILKQLARRIEQLRSEREDLSKRLGNLEKEKKMYETGRNIKLSREIEDRLDSLDIQLVFGLEWLKKQQLGLDSKRELISSNPFLPYSLIMNSRNIDKLRAEEAGVFTSFPIPIIEQEGLEKNLVIKVSNSIYTIGNMNFFMRFNDRLLNEEELKKLLQELSDEIIELGKNIEIKDSEIDKYSRDRNKVDSFSTGKADLDKLEKLIKEIKGQIEELGEERERLVDSISSLEKEQSELEASIKDIEKERKRFDEERESFSLLMSDYELYKINKNDFNQKNEELKQKQCEMDRVKKKADSEMQGLEVCKNQITEIKIGLNSINERSLKYLSFNEGRFIKKDMEDLEARFNAISEKIGMEVRELERALNDNRKSFERKEKELADKSREYDIQETEYNTLTYDEYKTKSLRNSEREMKKDLTDKQKSLNLMRIEMAKKEENLKHKLTEIQKLGREIPKDIIYITNLDFKTRKSIKLSEIENSRDNIKGCDANIKIVEDCRNRMNEYSGYVITQEKELHYSYADLDSVREKLKNSYMLSIDRESDMAKVLSDTCLELSGKAVFISDEFFKNTIDILEEIKQNPLDVISTINTVNEVHLRMLKQLETDLGKVDEEKKNILEMFYEYVQQIHEHLGRIDDNSTINIGGRYLKMLNIIQPEWEEKEEYYRLALKDFIEGIIKRCLDELGGGRNIEDIISKEITTIKLYDNVVGISEIDIRLYKIEASKQVQISWNQVSENSGGEGFLSAFVILTSLLSYMSKEESDIFKNSQEGKVIIMDNPFAQTNSEHLLKPLMDIAKKNNTQLICLSGLGGDSIYNRFDNIYVLTLIDSKLRQGMQYMESEHKKGEEITHMTTSRFKIKQEKAEQLMLF